MNYFLLSVVYRPLLMPAQSWSGRLGLSRICLLCRAPSFACFHELPVHTRTTQEWQVPSVRQSRFWWEESAVRGFVLKWILLMLVFSLWQPWWQANRNLLQKAVDADKANLIWCDFVSFVIVGFRSLYSLNLLLRSTCWFCQVEAALVLACETSRKDLETACEPLKTKKAKKS